MMLSSNQRNWAVFVGALVLTAAAAAIYLGRAGVSDETILVTLRLSAHVAFIVFLVVFAARPLRQLVRTPLTLALLRNRRLLGIAFAGIHTAHLGLILYRDRRVPEFDFSVGESLLGGVTYLLVYLMFLTSFDATTRALGPKNWRRLHKLGLYWIFVVFAATLLPDSLDDLGDLNWPLAILTAAALVVRLTAYLARRRHTPA